MSLRTGRRARRTAASSIPNKLGKDLLTVAAVPRRDILSLLQFAERLKREWRRGRPRPYLAGATLGLVFQKPSTRTRVSFEAAMNQLGGQAMVLSVSDIQLSRGETIEDTARVLSRYVDGLVVRTFDHAVVEQWAEAATIPVINGLTDFCHPCQALSDLMTIREKKGKLRGIKLAYVGDGNNVANSLIEGAAKTGMRISLGCPAGYEPDQGVVDRARFEAQASGGVIDIHTDPFVAVKDADAVYTDVWISMGREREQARRLRTLTPYQLNDRLLKVARSDAIVMHCLPAHRGQEITNSVLDGPRSVVFDQAENRLHMQKAILIRLLKGNSKK